MLLKANLVVGNLEAWVAVRPEHNKINEKAIQFFSFSYIFWNDILPNGYLYYLYYLCHCFHLDHIYEESKSHSRIYIS